MYFTSSYSLAQLHRMCVLLEANFISGKLNIHEEWKCYTTFLWYLLKPLNNILFCLHARANTHTHTQICTRISIQSHIPIYSQCMCCAHSLLYITFYAHRIYRSHNSTASKQNNRERRNKKENKLKKCIHSHVSAKYSLRFFM